MIIIKTGRKTKELELLMQMELVPGVRIFVNFPIKHRTRKQRSGPMRGYYKVIDLPA